MNQWTNMFILHVFCYGRSWYLIMLFKNKTFKVKWCHIVDVPTLKTVFWFLFQFHSWNSKIQPYSISCKFSATLNMFDIFFWVIEPKWIFKIQPMNIIDIPFVLFSSVLDNYLPICFFSDVRKIISYQLLKDKRCLH